MNEPIHDPTPIEIETLKGLFLETGLNPEANLELKRIASQDQIQFFIQLPIPKNDENSDSNEYRIFKIAISLITSCLKPFQNYDRDIDQEYLNRFVSSIHNNICITFYNILGCPIDEIRSQAAVIASQLIRIDLKQKREAKFGFSQKLMDDFKNTNDNFIKLGDLETFILCIEEDTINKKIREYRIFVMNLYEITPIIFNSNISKKNKIICLKTFHLLFTKIKFERVKKDLAFNCLTLLLKEFTAKPDSIEFYTSLRSATKAIICYLIPFMTQDIFDQLLEVISLNYLDGETDLQFLAMRIKIWKAIIKTEKEIRQSNFLQQIATNLCDGLLETICAGDYSNCANVDTYLAQYEALKALKILGEMIPEYLVSKAFEIYSEVSTENSNQVVLSMCILQVLIQINEISAHEIKRHMDQVFEICQNPNIDANTKNACLNVMHSFIECRLNDDENKVEIIEKLFATFDISFQSGNIQLYSSIFKILVVFFGVFKHLDYDSYVQVHASKLYEKIEQYLTISQHTNNVELIIAGYKSLYDFVKTLNFSDFIMRIYSIYAQKFQEHAQQFIQTRGISGETGIFEGISLVLRAISVKMILKVENEVFIDIIEIIFQTLEVSLEPYLINLLAQLVACLGPASSNYDEKICQIYNSCMETNNLLIICSCCNLISITFEEANQQTNYLRTVAINIWDSLYSFFTSNYPGDLETDYFNLILHGLTSMISFLPPQYFVEKRDNFFNSLDSITRNIPRFKKIDFGDDDYLVTLALLFQGYGKVIEMYREDEHSLIMDRNRQNESFLYANRQRYTTLFKIADENFDYNSSKNADNMVAAFLIFLDVLIKGIGQSISLELNAKWVRKLFDFASSSTNRFINNQAYHMRERYLNL